MACKRGKFIVFDGLDGCGKGSQLLRLHSYLFTKDKRNHVVATRNPYNSEYYDEIRRILKESSNPQENAELLADLFVKDRKVHARLVEFFLQEGFHVGCDRYKYSTLTYQQTQGIPLGRLVEMHKGVLVPDLAIILDVPAEVAMKRLAADEGREYKEVFEKLEFQEKLRSNFLALPDQLSGENLVVINGNRSFDEVFKAIRVEVDKVLAA